jgi:hypothetical protein
LVIEPISSIKERQLPFKETNTLPTLQLFAIVLDNMSLLPPIWL